MAHGSQEIGLGAAGRIGLVLGDAQIFLGMLAIRDVGADRTNERRIAGGVRNGKLDCQVGPNFAVDGDLILALDRASGLHDLPVVGHVNIRFMIREKLVSRLADDACALAEEVIAPRTGHDVPAFRILQVDLYRRVADDRLQAVLVDPRFLFRPLSFRDLAPQFLIGLGQLLRPLFHAFLQVVPSLTQFALDRGLLHSQKLNI